MSFVFSFLIMFINLFQVERHIHDTHVLNSCNELWHLFF